MSGATAHEGGARFIGTAKRTGKLVLLTIEPSCLAPRRCSPRPLHQSEKRDKEL
jgi:hypothetical protein